MTLFIFSMCQGFLLACICLVVEAGAGDFLKFEDRSNSLVKGCYHQNNSVALCLDIQRDFLKLTDKENKILVQYRRLPDQRFHAQLLDVNFVWYVSYFSWCTQFSFCSVITIALRPEMGPVVFHSFVACLLNIT